MRSWLFWVVAPLATIWASVMLSFTKNYESVSRISSRWGKAVLWSAGVDMTVVGDLPSDGRSYMVVANHSSLLDIAVLFAALRGMVICFGAKKELFRVPVLGWGMNNGGHFPIDRSSPRDAYVSLLRAVEERSDDGRSIAMFPEGSRSEDGRVKELKSGAFRSAVKYGVPILPVVIRGTYESMPCDKRQPRPSQVIACIGGPIETENRMHQELISEVRELITSIIGLNESA